MELIAVDVAALEIGAAFVLIIVTVAAFFWLHDRLLQRTVRRYQAELRARRPQAAAAASPVVAGHRFSARLRMTTTEERWLKTRRAATNDNSNEPPAERPAHASGGRLA